MTRAIRVLITAPKFIIGGHNQQAADLIQNLRRAYGVQVDLQPTDPALPGPLKFLYRNGVTRPVVRLALYSIQLLVRVPRYDIVHAYSAGLWSYALATLPALFVAKLYRRTLPSFTPTAA